MSGALPVRANLDATGWLARWEAMLDAYNPTRRERFDLMLELAAPGADSDLRVLDLGCGPGSVGFHILDKYPRARVTGVDFDPLLLEIGRRAARERGLALDFVQGDFRTAPLWDGLRGHYDLIVTTTALHWLKWENLARVYRFAIAALRPGAWFINSDHVAANDPDMQARNRNRWREIQEQRRDASGADDWDGFWAGLQTDLPELNLSAIRNAEAFWEGNDDGQPLEIHLNALRLAGYERPEVFWRLYGEAIIAARRPDGPELPPSCVPKTERERGNGGQ